MRQQQIYSFNWQITKFEYITFIYCIFFRVSREARSRICRWDFACAVLSVVSLYGVDVVFLLVSLWNVRSFPLCLSHHSNIIPFNLIISMCCVAHSNTDFRLSCSLRYIQNICMNVPRVFVCLIVYNFIEYWSTFTEMTSYSFFVSLNRHSETGL